MGIEKTPPVEQKILVIEGVESREKNLPIADSWQNLPTPVTFWLI
jgi:hypothetical protein